MDEICGLKFHLSYADVPQELVLEIPPLFNRKWLAHGQISKKRSSFLIPSFYRHEMDKSMSVLMSRE